LCVLKTPKISSAASV